MRAGVRPGGNRGARGGLILPPVAYGHDAGSSGDEREPPSGRSNMEGEGDDSGRGWAGRSCWAALAFWVKGPRGLFFFPLFLF